MALTPRRAAFVREYLIDHNGAQAAIRAGYAKGGAKEEACRLLTDVHVKKALSEAMSEKAQKLDISAEYVLQTIKNTVERCAQAEPVLDRDGTPTGEYKFDSNAVLKGAELLGKYLKLFTDKVDHSSSDGTMRPPAPVYKVVKE